MWVVNREVCMTKKGEYTSRRVASIASKILRDPFATRAEKSAAGSALTQARDRGRRRRR